MIETLGAIGGIVAGIAAILGAWVAYRQLKDLNSTLRMNGLMAVLSLESEMNMRKAALDDISFKIQQLDGTNPDQKIVEAHKGLLEGALQNYLNSADRMAFCIMRNYFPEREWRAEYRQYFSNIISAHEGKFGANTPYRNLKDLNDKWQRDK